MAEKYQQAFIREAREIVASIDGEQVKRIRFRAVLKWPEKNPDYKERPEGEDTRLSSEKRPTVWRSVSKVLECDAARGKKQTQQNMDKALREWRDQMEREANQGTTKATVVAYIDQYIADREAAQLIEPSTVRDYKSTLRRIAKRFSDTPLGELTADEVQAWQTSELQRGVSPTTMGKAYRLLSQACTHARKHGQLASNPMDLVDPPRRTPSKPNALDERGVKRLTAALMMMDATPLATAVFLTLHAGLRCGEACGLRWRDVDLDKMELHIEQAIGVAVGGAYVKPPKTKESARTVPIDSELADKLRERKAAMRRDLKEAELLDSELDFDSLYVCGTVAGGFANPTVMARDWTRLADSFGLVGTQGVRIKYVDLRHSYVSAAVRSGADVVNIAANAGHSSAKMTLDVYASPTKEGQRRVATAVGDAMRPDDSTVGYGQNAEILDLDKTGTE